MDDTKISGFAVLFTGVAALLFTFASAYQLLTGVLNIPSSEDLMSAFGDVLGPLILYAIRALYLGIMGWIGSIMTRRGVQITTALPKEAKAETTIRPKETQQTRQAMRAEPVRK